MTKWIKQDRNVRLKRCLCGNKPQIYETKYGDWYVVCPVCSKQPIPTYFTRKDAIKAWNMSINWRVNKEKNNV